MSTPLKNRKALSPMAATIIMIAVAVAAIFAVLGIAEWLSPAAGPPSKIGENLEINDVTFSSNSSAAISVTNTGADALTISDTTVNDFARGPVTYQGAIDGATGTLQKGQSGTITIEDWKWTRGNKYTFAVVTNSGHKYKYTTTAPP